MTRLALTVSACALFIAGPVPALAQQQAPTAAVRTAVAPLTADQRAAAVLSDELVEVAFSAQLVHLPDVRCARRPVEASPTPTPQMLSPLTG